jgi:hypothetical protein
VLHSVIPAAISTGDICTIPRAHGDTAGVNVSYRSIVAAARADLQRSFE